MALLAKVRDYLRGPPPEYGQVRASSPVARGAKRPRRHLPRRSYALAAGGSVRLSFAATGRGPTVLLIGGLAMTAEDWWRTVPVLAESFRVVTFDNRGVGRSGAAPPPHSVAEMADDAAAVLEAAGAAPAHVYGVSLGGMVAQELALRHPERVSALVLGATTPGGLLSVPPDPAVIAYFMRHRGLSSDEAVWAAVPHLYSRRTREQRPELIAEDAARRLRRPVDRAVYAAQVSAGMRHDALSRLGAILAPTLVVHGDEDVVVPAANGRTLATHIPDAELALWANAGHMYSTDQPEADHDVARFLVSRSSNTPTSAVAWGAGRAA
jgi:pimeloyl-ACP methyl ester carboxylesterase